jgi:hypothetical protein
VFVVYAFLMTVGTHWPGFRLRPEVPVTDTALHLVAFGGLTWLLWRTRWIRRRLVVVLVALAWSGLDELSQALPILDRTPTWQDHVANALGVLVAGTWLWALRPVGGTLNRRRLALAQFAFDQLFRAPGTWVVLVGAFLACALPPVLAWRVLSPAGTTRLILIASVVWVVSSLGLFASMWRQQQVHVAEDEPCFACGASCRGVAYDDAGVGPCPSCRRTVRNGQWDDPTPPTAAGHLRLMAWPCAVVALIVAAILAPPILGAVLVNLSMQADPVGVLSESITRSVHALSPAMVMTIDLAIGLTLMAVATRVYRGRLAVCYDQSVSCRRCHHDLRGTPTPRGIGQCGECGAPFMRD